MRKLDWLLVAGVLIAIGWGVYVMYDALNPSKRYNTSLWEECEQVFRVEIDRGRALALDANGDLETRQVIARKKVKLCTMI